MPGVGSLAGLGRLLARGYSRKLDPTNTTFPFDTDILLQRRARLQVNHQGCVNTLARECQDWLAVHSKDGRNQTARATFPCYIMVNNTEFVVTRHSVPAIHHLLTLMLALPLTLWTASCSCVAFISCCIKIDDWGHFRVSVAGRVAGRAQHKVRPGPTVPQLTSNCPAPAAPEESPPLLQISSSLGLPAYLILSNCNPTATRYELQSYLI